MRYLAFLFLTFLFGTIGAQELNNPNNLPICSDQVWYKDWNNCHVYLDLGGGVIIDKDIVKGLPPDKFSENNMRRLFSSLYKFKKTDSLEYGAVNLAGAELLTEFSEVTIAGNAAKFNLVLNMDNNHPLMLAKNFGVGAFEFQVELNCVKREFSFGYYVGYFGPLSNGLKIVQNYLPSEVLTEKKWENHVAEGGTPDLRSEILRATSVVINTMCAADIDKKIKNAKSNRQELERDRQQLSEERRRLEEKKHQQVVEKIEYDGGRFERKEKSYQWQEYKTASGYFADFSEKYRDSKFIFLHDNSRNLTLRIPIMGGTIHWSNTEPESWQELFKARPLRSDFAPNNDRTDIQRERQQITENTNQDQQTTVTDSRRRFALVIGNSNYSSLSKLPNAINDARTITQSLRSSGFQVSTYENLDLVGMQNAVRGFGEKLGKNDVGLVYYAGHGVQVKGKNYLIPVRENIKKSFEVPSSAVDVDLVLATLEHIKNDLNIVVLDACRSSFPGEARGTNRGLATIEAAKGTFIAFATAPGKEALDGSGSNSPYTKHLARLIGKKGLPLEQVFKEVRKAVVAETNGEQVPWENSSLMGDFYFQK